MNNVHLQCVSVIILAVKEETSEALSVARGTRRFNRDSASYTTAPSPKLHRTEALPSDGTARSALLNVRTCLNPWANCSCTLAAAGPGQFWSNWNRMGLSLLRVEFSSFIVSLKTYNLRVHFYSGGCLVSLSVEIADKNVYHQDYKIALWLCVMGVRWSTLIGGMFLPVALAIFMHNTGILSYCLLWCGFMYLLNTIWVCRVQLEAG